MKVIVFDLLCSQPVGKVKFHGGGEYTKTVFKFFINHYKGNSKIVVCFNQNLYIDDWIIKSVENNFYVFKQVESSSDIVKTLYQYETETEIRFFAGLSYGYNRLTFPENVTKIGTCHGLRALEKPTDKYVFLYYKTIPLLKEIIKTFLQKPLYKKYYKIYQAVIRDFDIIITDSYHSAYSIKLNYPDLLKGKELYVFYPLTQMDESYVSNMERTSDNKYILMISADRWIKNSYRGIMAIDSLYEKGLLHGVKTKVYGSAPTQIRKMIKNSSDFEFYDYVTNEQLEGAYKNCEIMFYPTLNEGFGNVPMEAMKYGKTCVISAVCSLPEVYGQSVYYCNPYDIMEMQNRILQAIEHKISVDCINQRLDYLRSRQNNDMIQLCNMLTGENRTTNEY